MSSHNHDIQASHKILQLIERSKRESDSFLDTIPGIFAVINAEGDILRGNTSLADYMEVDQERLLYKNLNSVFQKEEWELFKLEIDALDSKEKGFVDFELSMTSPKGASSPHLWYLSIFDEEKTGERMFTVVGKDISDLKEAQQNLIEIFSSVPLGILTIGEGGAIQGEFSKYLEVIMGTNDIHEKKIQDFMFSEFKEITKQNQESLDGLVDAIGQNKLIYEIISEGLPKKVKIDTVGEVKWLRINYQSISYNDIVRKILLIVEDITSLVKAEELKKQNSLLEEKSVARIVQLKKVDPETFRLLFDEFNELFQKLKKAEESVYLGGVKNYLHGIKGCARVAGLDFLAELTHECESNVKENEDLISKNSDGATLTNLIFPVIEEWNELNDLSRALFQSSGTENEPSGNEKKIEDSFKGLFDQYNQLLVDEKDLHVNLMIRKVLIGMESLTKDALSSLEKFVTDTVESTCASLDKQVDLHLDWDGIYADRSTIKILKDCLLHLITNSIDHGIETSEERKLSGKTDQGNIYILVTNDISNLKVKFWDDGAGVNIERVRNIAIDKNLVTLEKGNSLNDNEVIQLIFTEGLSSAETISMTSGRGVGLSAVKEEIENLNGTIFATNYDNTLRVDVDIPLGIDQNEEKGLVDYNEFMDDFALEIKNLNSSSRGIDIEIDTALQVSSKESTFFAMKEMLLFALIELIDVYAENSKETLFISEQNSMISMRVKVSNTKNIEKYILDTCSLYLSKHSGKYQIIDNVLCIDFGFLNKKVKE